MFLFILTVVTKELAETHDFVRDNFASIMMIDNEMINVL